MTTSYDNLFDLTGTTTLLTGSLGLIGSEVADALARAGSDLGLLDNGDSERLQAQADDLMNRHKIDAVDLPADITQLSSVTDALDRLNSEISCPDVLIHLAASDAKADKCKMDSWGDLRTFPVDTWEDSVEVNLTGTFLVTREVIDRMVEIGGGNVVLVGSTYSLVGPNPDLYSDDRKGQAVSKTKPPDYVATKSAIPNFTRYIATSYADAGIRANCIVPHGVDDGDHDSCFLERFAELSPMGRMCRPEELRGPFIFLASEASSYMTGSSLTIDGGWTAC